MDILTKHKKKGLQGFKEFVYYLESAEARRLEDVLLLAWLEDPVYSQYLEFNFVNFDFFLKKLDAKDCEEIFKALPNGPQTFTLALKGSPERVFIIEKLNPLITRKIVIAEEIIPEITKQQRSESRNVIIKKMRELQDLHKISPFHWKLPPEKILKGEHFIIPSSGPYKLNYETGILALEGGFDKKARSGLWNHYNPNGNVFARGHYSEGEKIGNWTFHFTDGKLKAEGQYIENLRSGKWKIYDDKGSASIITYERGRPI